MPTDEVAASLPPEILEKAKALVEAAGPDHDWSGLIAAVDEMMKGAAALQGIDFEKMEKNADEAMQLLKVHTKS